MPQFVSNVPVSSNPPRVDQPTMTANNIYLNADNSLSQVGLNVDHFFSGNSATSKDGYHRWVRAIRTPVSGTAPTTVNGTIALYNDTAPNVPGSGSAWWVYRDGTLATKHQLTGPNPSVGTNGYTYLPGGLLIQWGTIALSGNVTNPVGFGTSFTTACYNVQFCPFRNGTGSPGSTFVIFVDSTSISKTGFNIINRSTHDYGYYWTAIGA